LRTHAKPNSTPVLLMLKLSLVYNAVFKINEKYEKSSNLMTEENDYDQNRLYNSVETNVAKH